MPPRRSRKAAAPAPAPAALTKAQATAKWTEAYKILMKQKNVGYSEFATAIEGLSPEYMNKRKQGLYGKNFLDKAIDMKAVRIATLVVDKGANVNVTKEGEGVYWGGSPLEHAVGTDSLEMVQMLLAKGADVNNGYKSPLAMCSVATKNGAAMAAALVAAGADINLASGLHKYSPLKFAIGDSNKKVYDYLLSKEARLEEDAILDVRPTVGGLAICKDLVKRGVNVNVVKPFVAGSHVVDGNVLHILLGEWISTYKHVFNKTFKDLLEALTTAGVNWRAKRPSDGCEPLQAMLKRGAQWVGDVTPGLNALLAFVLAKGADINATEDNGYASIHWAVKTNDPLLHKIVELGANINIFTTDGLSPLTLAIKSKSRSAVEFLCAQAGLDINALSPGGSTALMGCPAKFIDTLLGVAGIEINKVGPNGSALHQAREGAVVEKLVAAGGDINLRDAKGLTPLYYAAYFGRDEVIKAMAAVPALEKGAIISRGETIVDLARRGKFTKVPTTNDLLISLLADDEPKWAGWTSNDLDKFDTVFDEAANEFSCCPVCLKYVGREDGCMYMRGHDCSSHRGDYYHKELYTKYKSEQGHIYWCTICGRIALGHRHYELGPALGPKASLVVLPRGGADPFSNDCKVTEGGGGRHEKMARFRRLREYALELQEEVGTKTHTEAMNELVEEMWNAPLARKVVLKKIAAEKKWNIDATMFPAPPPPPAEAVIDFASFPDIKQKPEDAAALVPTVLAGRDAITQDDEDEVIQFHHVQPDGGVYNHENNYIGADSLTHMVGQFVGGWKLPTFGLCWENHGCKGRLWPEEIKPYVPAALYEDYKAKFNWRFRAGQGGGARRQYHCTNGWCGPKTLRGGKRSDNKRSDNKRSSKKNFFKEVTDAQCMLPPKKRTTRKVTSK